MDIIEPQEAPPAAQESSVNEVLEALSRLEAQADSLAGKLEVFEQPHAAVPANELAHLREGLKRISARVGTTVALAERIVAAEGGEGWRPAKSVVTEEDVMFPMEGVGDKITGLPSRTIAEKAIDAALSGRRGGATEKERYVAIFALDRVCQISGRYGLEAGHQALVHFAQFLNQKLPPDSLLFRWRGAAFVAIFSVFGTHADATRLIEQIAIRRQKFNFVTNNRTAMVNVTMCSHTIPLAGPADPGVAMEQIDHFIEGHSVKQPH
ncbi:MAG TPA: diguanylate cyclase [Bryobacteraceae bacterium]|jgi:GGDEF domain-containing protein